RLSGSIGPPHKGADELTVRHNVSSAKKQRDVPYYFLVYGKLSKNSFRTTGKTGRLTPENGRKRVQR
ncbi:MAG: hypothetical protein II950_01670, partial [Prevotella sp.]|nr:hypothetical protein [Prevotella sp.]